MFERIKRFDIINAAKITLAAVLSPIALVFLVAFLLMSPMTFVIVAFVVISRSVEWDSDLD